MPTILRDNIPLRDQIELERHPPMDVPVDENNSAAFNQNSGDGSMQYLSVNIGGGDGKGRRMSAVGAGAAIGARDYLDDGDDTSQIGGDRHITTFTQVSDPNDEVTMFSVTTADDPDIEIPKLDRPPDIFSGTETEEWSASEATSVSEEDSHDMTVVDDFATVEDEGGEYGIDNGGDMSTKTLRRRKRDASAEVCNSLSICTLYLYFACYIGHNPRSLTNTYSIYKS